MSEYEILGIVLVGLTSIVTLVATISKPINKLTNAVTRLDENVKDIKNEFNIFVNENKATHEKLWNRTDDLRAEIKNAENIISNHEYRLSGIEHKLTGI